MLPARIALLRWSLFPTVSENLAAGGIIEPEPNLKKDESAKDPLPHLDYDDSSALNSIIHVALSIT